jgi:hypothetical protein
MSAQLDKTKDIEDKKNKEDEEYFKEDEDFDDEEDRKPSRRDKLSRYDSEEEEENYVTPDRNLGDGRLTKRREDEEEEDDREVPSGSMRSHEQDGLLPRTEGEGEKHVSYQFTPIAAEADSKKFDEITRPRFSFGARFMRA